MAVHTAVHRTTHARPHPPSSGPFGALLREWRQRRHLSQLALALEADVSQRHLSFVESGRAQPSRAMVRRLAEQMHVPLRDRNRFLLAAGYAPTYAERPLSDPALAPARAAVERVLAGHEPFRRSPSIGTGRSWPRTARSRRCSRASPRRCSRRRSTCSGSASTRTGWRRAS